MHRRFFFKLTAVQVAVILAVIGLFLIFPPRTAGLIAGVIFVVLAIATIWLTRSRPLRGGAHFTSWLFFLGAVVPILGARLLNWDVDFKDVQILGISGPQFHRISSVLYGAMIAGSVVDGFRFSKE